MDALLRVSRISAGQHATDRDAFALVNLAIAVRVHALEHLLEDGTARRVRHGDKNQMWVQGAIERDEPAAENPEAWKGAQIAQIQRRTVQREIKLLTIISSRFGAKSVSHN